MRRSVYIETTIISYLAANPHTDIIRAAHQLLTWQWWNERKQLFDLFASELVYQEASAGDANVALRRLALLKNIPRLESSPIAEALAEQLVTQKALPQQAVADAAHIAIAAAHNVDYLLTWNCRHLANISLQKRVWTVIQTAGLESPLICTPEQLMEK